MRVVTTLVMAALLVGCGADDDETAARPSPSPSPAAAEAAAEETPAPRDDDRQRRRGIRLRVDDSEFGSMLFDSRRQAIYIFERDPEGRSVCYGECAQAWPPVLTRGKPVAGRGVRASLLGTIKRRGGRRQVTYGGKPLYFYAHERPGEVRCHNVNLNGGLWWVIGPNGRRRA
jgi:predicted lipoprotein with Yx(FWY)xxD motif